MGTSTTGRDDRWRYERLFSEQGFTRIAGVDEVGRGPLAGPVVACAAIIPDDFEGAGIDDSKALSAQQRLAVYPRIATEALSWAIGVVDAQTIDQINILRASFLAMRQAIEELSPPPDALLVDGNHKIPDIRLPQVPVIKGDQRSLSIACASILAKEIRDRIMEEYHRDFPEYGFLTNKGYATAQHLEALERHGPTPIHRQSFRTLQIDAQHSLAFDEPIEPQTDDR